MNALNLAQLNQVAGGVQLGASNVDISIVYLSTTCQNTIRIESSEIE